MLHNMARRKDQKWTAKDYRQITALLGRQTEDQSGERYDALRHMAAYYTDKSNGYSLLMQNMADMWLYISRDRKRMGTLKNVLNYNGYKDIFELIAAIADMQVEISRVDE